MMKRCLAGVLLVLAGCLLVCWHFGIWSRQDYMDYQYLGDNYALGHDLWHGRIGQGQDVEDVTLKAQPHCISRLGRFTELSYFPGGPRDGGIPMEMMVLVGKDGKLISAGFGGCFGERYFFRMNREDDKEYQKEVQRRFIDHRP